MIRWLLFFFFFTGVTSCTRERAPLGSADNPIKFYFVPSVDVKILEDTSNQLKKYMESHTPYHFKVAVPPSYIAVVEAFGTKRVDVAALNTYGYVLAHDRYGAEARLVTVRFGETSYKAQFLARNDSKIKKLEDLNGKKVAFVDPASVSGYLLPMKYLKDRGIKPKETVFAMRHDNVVSMIYQRQVDAGATFYSPPVDGQIQDARRLAATQYPDVEKKIKIIELSNPIPNDPVVFSKEMPEEIKTKLIQAMVGFAQTPEGIESLKKISSVTGLVPCTDKDFEGARKTVNELGAEVRESVAH